MRKFKVEHDDYEKPLIYVMLYKPPYENENILHKTKWNAKDCTITDVTPKFQGEE